MCLCLLKPIFGKNEIKKFHHEDWDVEKGFIMRSTRFDQRNRANPTAYTSLIIDTSKP